MPANVDLQFRDCEASTAAPARGGSTLRDLTPAATLLVAGLIGLFVASLSGSAARGQYLVIAAPGSSLGRTLELIGSADGGFVDAGRFQNIAIAYSSRADFADRAKEAGAWLVVPAPRIAGCFGAQTEVTRR